MGRRRWQHTAWRHQRLMGPLSSNDELVHQQRYRRRRRRPREAILLPILPFFFLTVKKIWKEA